MGNVPKPETKRNKKISEDYLKKDENGDWKYTVEELGEKYSRRIYEGSVPLSRNRIYQILRKTGTPRNRKKH